MVLEVGGKAAICDYQDCMKPAKPEPYFTSSDCYGGGDWHVCEEHEDSVEDKTGYCGVECQFGHGCTGEC
jgi:hypothetical protein